MCIIFYNEKGKDYNLDELSIAYDNNPHGVGFMWVEEGKVKSSKALLTKKEFFDTLPYFKNVPHALHLRWRTVGKISKELCHPFKASHPTLNNSVYMMHNGTFHNMNVLKGLSDTHAFSYRMQDITLNYGTDVLFHQKFILSLEEQIKTFNKVIFLRDDGKVSILNSKQWTIKNDIWYSNTYSLIKNWRANNIKKNKEKKEEIIKSVVLGKRVIVKRYDNNGFCQEVILRT